MPPDARGVLLHVSPHPDDELIGAGATLMRLRENGMKVLNLAVSVGRPSVSDRRRAELADACRRAGFSLRIPHPPLGISRGDDLGLAEERLQATLLECLSTVRPAIVVSPSPHDGHHGHEVVGRAVREALRAASEPPPWWMWGLWADLPLPTIFSPFDHNELLRLVHALDAYEGELSRNDYRRLVEGRAMANAVLGPERVFGFGSEGSDVRYAELLTEAFRRDGAWYLGAPRTLDPKTPVQEGPRLRIDAWVDSASLAELLLDTEDDRA